MRNKKRLLDLIIMLLGNNRKMVNSEREDS